MGKRTRPKEEEREPKIRKKKGGKGVTCEPGNNVVEAFAGTRFFHHLLLPLLNHQLTTSWNCGLAFGVEFFDFSWNKFLPLVVGAIFEKKRREREREKKYLIVVGENILKILSSIPNFCHWWIAKKPYETLESWLKLEKLKRKRRENRLVGRKNKWKQREKGDDLGKEEKICVAEIGGGLDGSDWVMLRNFEFTVFSHPYHCWFQHCFTSNF